MTGRRLGLVIVGAGWARRMSGVDKLWAPLGAHPVIWHAVAKLAPAAHEIVMVVRQDQVERVRESLRGIGPRLSVVPGGAERQDSVAAGLAALSSVEAVAVHDAARPFASVLLLQEGLALLDLWDGAVPAVEVRDTIKQIGPDGRVVGTLERATLRAAQTPQVFRADVLRSAHERARAIGVSGTDDAALVETAGFRVRTFPGSPANFKITTADDLLLARFMLEREG